MRILGIESSADDSGVALIEATGEFGRDFAFSVLGNAVSSQDVHASYGGIYPHMAKREHTANLPITLERALREAGEDLEKPAIDAIAVTVGPGLEPCLWCGITFAQELAAKWKVPVVATNHMEGHIVTSMMDFSNMPKGTLAPFEFPALALLVSGGHTEIILMKGPPGGGGHYQYIGRTRDDAAGEAFDKIGRLLGIPYPAGAEISRLAREAREENLPRMSKLTRPMREGYEFSFSGLKTAVLREVEAQKEITEEYKKDMAREVEETITDVLVEKTVRAADEFGVASVIMSGGVSANTFIRENLDRKLQDVGAKLFVCPPKFSTDNGLMIALAGYFHAAKREFADPATLKANGVLKLA